MEKERLDTLLFRSGRTRSRREAQALIMSGRVEVDGVIVDKPGTRVSLDADVAVAGPPREFVSRAGRKLAGALEAFGIDPAGMTVLDVGASTGGFTDCLLRRGAGRVVALDVGRGLLDWGLRRDPRVIVVEGVNARYLDASMIPGDIAAFDLATIDVAFISLRLVLPPVAALTARIVALVKPQFEVGPERVGRGGIVREAAARGDAIVTVASFARNLGLGVAGIAPALPRGAEGNQEYFLHLHRGSRGLTAERIETDASTLTRREP